jgi:hypothetical protein
MTEMTEMTKVTGSIFGFAAVNVAAPLPFDERVGYSQPASAHEHDNHHGPEHPEPFRRPPRPVNL